MSKATRRTIIGGAVASSVALLTGKSSAAKDTKPKSVTFENNGEKSMSLQEFRALNGSGSVAALIGQMECETLSMCHRKIEEEHGIWIPELVPIFEEMDARSEPKSPAHA